MNTSKRSQSGPSAIMKLLTIGLFASVPQGSGTFCLDTLRIRQAAALPPV
jgi:hypothetical protein